MAEPRRHHRSGRRRRAPEDGPAGRGQVVGWRLLLTGPGEPGFNMALDEALAIAVRRGWSPPTLRIFQWRQPAVSLGCHQPLTVLDGMPGLEDRRVIVRRPTAGGAVAHDRDVSYALACDAARALQGRPSRRLAQRFHEALALALTARGRYYTVHLGQAAPAPETAVCFQQPVLYDVMRGSLKIAGAAQRRWRDGLLQQGTVRDPACSPDRLALGIRMAWAAVFGRPFAVGTLTAQEHLLADELWSKYRPWTPSSWPPVFPSASNR